MREYEQGESLRRVHWRSTARRGELMVKELEDAPRDEIAVLLDADATAVVGESFDVQVRAAGSILESYVRRGRRAVLVVNSERRDVQQVHSAAADWRRALELLAAAEPSGRGSVARLLAEHDGPAARALELAVVTARLDAGLVDRLVQRALSRRRVSRCLRRSRELQRRAAPAARAAAPAPATAPAFPLRSCARATTSLRRSRAHRSRRRRVLRTVVLAGVATLRHRGRLAALRGAALERRSPVRAGGAGDRAGAPAAVVGAPRRCIAIAAFFAVCIAFSVSPLHIGQAGSRFSRGFLDFYDFRLPIDPQRNVRMHEVILIAIFAFALVVAQAIAARRAVLP